MKKRWNPCPLTHPSENDSMGFLKKRGIFIPLFCPPSFLSPFFSFALLFLLKKKKEKKENENWKDVPPDCFLWVLFFSRRGRRLRRPEKNQQTNGPPRTSVPTRVRYAPPVCFLWFLFFSVGVGAFDDPRTTLRKGGSNHGVFSSKFSFLFAYFFFFKRKVWEA